jgi:hypothetical protein
MRKLNGMGRWSSRSAAYKLIRVEATGEPRAQHELVMAFLGHWLGQRPLSEEMKRPWSDRLEVAGRANHI